MGKTYLAAFDSQKYRTVLFVAHREEILKQAAESFRNVRRSDEYGFFDGKSKCTDKPVIFASVATLGNIEYLNDWYFPRDYFQYLVVDEFHHAVTDQYQRIVAYFKPESEEYPDDCLVDFDMRLIDLFEQMEKKHRRLQDMVREEFYRVRDLLGHRPTRLELFTYMDADIYQMAVERANVNPFRKYFVYLHDLNELKAEETELYQSIGREFIQLIETTNMTKVYKMPVLLAFYNDGHMRMEVTEEQLLASWKRFFGKKETARFRRNS